MQATPATWRLMLEAGWRGSKGLKIVCGGEALSRELAQQLLTRGDSVWNLYGPTETTIWSALYRVESGEGSVPIGRAIANTWIYVLDRYLQPVAIGVPGEVYIGGDGLARGYLNYPELTAERFMPDPWSREPGARLYRTGDVGRYLSDGNIEFLGRIDHQVKVRGFRVELGEIEAVLAQHPAVGETVVLAREEVENPKSEIQNPKSAEKRLVAYIVPRSSAPTVSELRDFLQQKLPDYMVPSAFMFLDALPLTPNGKVDRRALPAPDQTRPELEEAFVAPRDTLELQLTKIWENVLDVKPVGAKDNFFDLGGHSLLAVRLFAQIEKVTGRNLPLAVLFQAPTVEHLAAVLRQERGEALWSSLVEIQPGGSKPPFFGVHAHEGNILFYRDLARHLGKDQPFYGLQAQGLDGKQTPYREVEEMAAHHVKEIRALQPKGPYFLGGYCFGGVVAFEMAQQLHAQGEKVALLALFDAYAPGYQKLYPEFTPFGDSLRYFIRRAGLHLGNLSLLGTKEKLNYIKGRTKRIADKFSLGTGLPSLGIRRKIMGAMRQAAINYDPQVYRGSITLFRATTQPAMFDHDPKLGWGRLAAGDLEIHQVPGYYGTMMLEPHVRVLAEQLRACLLAGHPDESNKQT
jgi:aspartate racemase